MKRSIVPVPPAGSQPSKLERFERLAERRVTQALRQLRLIGNLSNRHNYEYTDDQVRQVVDALEAAIKDVKSRFRQEGGAGGRTFSFRK